MLTLLEPNANSVKDSKGMLGNVFRKRGMGGELIVWDRLGPMGDIRRRFRSRVRTPTTRCQLLLKIDFSSQQTPPFINVRHIDITTTITSSESRDFYDALPLVLQPVLPTLHFETASVHPLSHFHTQVYTKDAVFESSCVALSLRRGHPWPEES